MSSKAAVVSAIKDAQKSLVAAKKAVAQVKAMPASMDGGKKKRKGAKKGGAKKGKK